MPSDRNRRRFVLPAIRREIALQRRLDLRRSLRSPHPETSKLEKARLTDWASTAGGRADLVEAQAGTPVRWVPGRGWREVGG
jgi:hypothetical protein